MKDTTTVKAPCKDCPDRVSGCHSVCKKYQAFCRENEERREEKHSQVKQNEDYWKARRKGVKKKGML